MLWSPLAKIAEQYLSKGKQVYIEGKLTSRSYVDKEGETKYITEVVGQNLVLLGSSKVGLADVDDTSPISISNVIDNGDSNALPF